MSGIDKETSLNISISPARTDIPGDSGKSKFLDFLGDAAKTSRTVYTVPDESNASIPKFGHSRPQGSAMPDDKDFLVIDDVAVGKADDGDDVVVVSGEAVNGADASAIAAQGKQVVVPLSRFASRSIPGTLFASILLDQRSGILSNPFSLMRIAESMSPDVVRTDFQTPSDQPSEDAIAEGKEISKLEATIAALTDKHERMSKTMGVVVGSTAAESNDSMKNDTPRT